MPLFTSTTFVDVRPTNSGDVTTWLYDEASNCMTNKVYADGKGPRYSYTPNGNVAQRIWARGIITDYAYDGWNNLTNTTYSDGTPTVTLFYDAMDRQIKAEDAAGITTFRYDSFGSLTNETVVGIAGTNTIIRHWDEFSRTAGYTLNNVRQTTIGYDAATGRIATMLVNGSDIPFTWSYIPGSDLKSSLTYPNGLTASWTYDANDQLLQVLNVTPTNVISQYDYTYDAAGRRIEIARSGSAMSESRTDAYGYNVRNELTSASRLGGTSSVTSTIEYAYNYDDIGNRLSSFDLGTNRSYTANSLNQYSSISNLCDSMSLCEEFIPQFDDDGNQTLIQTATGIWQVQYNGENRPVHWERIASNSSTPNSSNPTLVSMSFDRKGRRVQYIETCETMTASNKTFTYDGYLQIANHELTVHNSQLFIWNPTEPIATHPLVFYTSTTPPLYYTHDANKNISDLTTSFQATSHHYEYGPFGVETEAVNGRLTTNHNFQICNPFRFSSEYSDVFLGVIYYNYRHLELNLGRWLSRDCENGITEYVFIDNAAIECFDELGLIKSPSKNADRDNNGGHKKRGNGNRINKHQNAQKHGGRINAHFVRHDRRGKVIPPPVKGKCGYVNVKTLLAVDAINAGVMLSGIILKEMEAAGSFDEFVDWNIEIEGSLCCVEPKTPQIVKKVAITRTGKANLNGPLWGFLTPDVTANYEFEKKVVFTFECCCSTPKNTKRSVEIRRTPISYDWIWGLGGSAKGVAEWRRITEISDCE